MTLEVYRTRVWPEGFRLRWTHMPCADDTGRCEVEQHCLAFIGFDFDGMDRWIPVTELIDSNEEEAEAAIQDAVVGLLEGWALLAAAFGLPWADLTAERAVRVGQSCWGLTPFVYAELFQQGVEGLLRMRSLVGRDLHAMPPLLAMLAGYRQDVGGSYKEGMT